MSIANMQCDYCERTTDVLVTYGDGTSVCLDCRNREQERVADEFRKMYGPDYDLLATYQAEGR